MGIFDKFRQGLTKTRDAITQGFKNVATVFGYIDVDDLDDLEVVLIQADIGAEASMEIIDNVKDQVRSAKNNRSDHVLALMRGEIKRILGPSRQLDLRQDRLNILLMVGVNGTGKTTTAGKLAARYKAEGMKVMMAAADTFRAAAIDQLKVWGERTDTPVIAEAEGSDPASVVFTAIEQAQSQGTDLLIIDTAGRLHNKKNLMDELGKIRRIITRQAADANVETLLVIDATTGQNAVLQTKAFTEVADVTGLVITKLDGNAKGGVAVAVAHEAQVPIYLAGLGEQVDDLVDWDSELFARSLIPEDLEV